MRDRGTRRRRSLVDVGTAVVPVCADPGVELRPPDEDLSADAVAWERVLGMLEAVAELADREPAIAREGLERQEWIERRANHDSVGQHAADLGDRASIHVAGHAAMAPGATSAQPAASTTLRRSAGSGAHRTPTSPGSGLGGRGVCHALNRTAVTNAVPEPSRNKIEAPTGGIDAKSHEQTASVGAAPFPLTKVRTTIT
jgi:hypothetical protein